MNGRQLAYNLRCPRRGCNGMLKVPYIPKGHCFSGHKGETFHALDVRCLRCNLRFIVTNPNSVYTEDDIREIERKSDGKR